MQDETTSAAPTSRSEASGADGYQSGSIVTIRPTQELITRQGLPNFVGVSAETAGSRGLCMNMVVIPPGGAAEPHFHEGFETAIYL